MKFASLLNLLFWIQGHVTHASEFLVVVQASDFGIEELQHQPITRINLMTLPNYSAESNLIYFIRNFFFTNYAKKHIEGHIKCNWPNSKHYRSTGKV